MQVSNFFMKALESKESQSNNQNKQIILLVFLNEMGLAERASKIPLKVILVFL